MAKDQKTVQRMMHDDSLCKVPDFEVKDLYKLVGAGYEDYWWFTGRYCVLKGS